MAEHVSLSLQLMRDELAIQRQRRDAERAVMARIVAGEKLGLKRGRALVLAPVSLPTPVEVPAPPPPSVPPGAPVASHMSLGAWSGRASLSVDPET